MARTPVSLIHPSTWLVLALVLGSTVVYSAPIGTLTPDNLNLTIQIDSANHLHGQLLLTLSPSSHHLVNVSTLWPIFTHALPPRVDNGSAYFAVIGVHTHRRTVTLCERLSSGRYRALMNGTNLGLVWKLPDAQLVCLYNPHPASLTVRLLLNLYDNFHPIPGGCNIEFALEESPFLLVHQQPTGSLPLGPLIDVIDYQPASLGNERSPGRQCGLLSRGRLKYELYAYSSHHSEDTEEEYFRVLDAMSSRRWLSKHATLIRQIGHKQHNHSHHSLSRISADDTAFQRLFLITSLNQQIYFNILVIDEDAETTWESQFNASLDFSQTNPQTKNNNYRELSSLYVPSQIISHVAVTNYVQLFISLSALALFSLIVSIIGFRHFILELFYFSFLLSLGSLLLLSSKISSSKSSAFPGISWWSLLAALVSSLLVATIWTELCRRSRNLKFAFSGHSLTLSIILVAFATDIFLTLPVAISSLLTNTAYLTVLALPAIILCHAVFIVYLDYFLLSALSASFTTVYFILLPIDLAFFSGTLFRILLQLFLVLTQYSANSGTVIVTFIVFTTRDLILLLLFTFIVSGSVYWQILSKLASKGYAFGCLAPSRSPQLSASSIGTTLSLQIQDQAYGTTDEAKKDGPSRRRTPKSIKIRKGKSKSRSPSRGKLFRCKNCGKLSTSRDGHTDLCSRRRRLRPSRSKS